jgi:hypothetical protein
LNLALFQQNLVITVSLYYYEIFRKKWGGWVSLASLEAGGAKVQVRQNQATYRLHSGARSLIASPQIIRKTRNVRFACSDMRLAALKMGPLAAKSS